jgi:hypothetical protein
MARFHENESGDTPECKGIRRYRHRDSAGTWKAGLTEHSSGCVITGETGLAHTRTKTPSISINSIYVYQDS